LADCVEVDLHLLEFDAGIRELVIEVAVSMDLAGKSPIVVVDEGIVE